MCKNSPSSLDKSLCRAASSCPASLARRSALIENTTDRPNSGITRAPTSRQRWRVNRKARTHGREGEAHAQRNEPTKNVVRKDMPDGVHCKMTWLRGKQEPWESAEYYLPDDRRRLGEYSLIARIPEHDLPPRQSEKQFSEREECSGLPNVLVEPNRLLNAHAVKTTAVGHKTLVQGSRRGVQTYIHAFMQLYQEHI